MHSDSYDVNFNLDDDYSTLVNAALSAARSKKSKLLAQGVSPSMVYVKLSSPQPARRGTNRVIADGLSSVNIAVGGASPSNYSRGMVWLCTDPASPNYQLFLISTTTTPVIQRWFPIQVAKDLFNLRKVLIQADFTPADVVKPILNGEGEVTGFQGPNGPFVGTFAAGNGGYTPIASPGPVTALDFWKSRICVASLATTVHVPNTLMAEFECNFVTSSVSQITFVGVDGAVIRNAYGHTKTSGTPWEIATLARVSTNEFLLYSATGV